MRKCFTYIFLIVKPNHKLNLIPNFLIHTLHVLKWHSYPSGRYSLLPRPWNFIRRLQKVRRVDFSCLETYSSNIKTEHYPKMFKLQESYISNYLGILLKTLLKKYVLLSMKINSYKCFQNIIDRKICWWRTICLKVIQLP